MMLLYVKGDSTQALNAAHFRGLDTIGVMPTKDWPDVHKVYVRPDPAVWEWMRDTHGKGPYEPGTLLWFKLCEEG